MTETTINRDHQEEENNDSSSIAATIQRLLQFDDDNSIVIKGSDSNGHQYSSIEDMWKALGVLKANKEATKQIWYDKAANYYESNCEATIDGVLGGFASISDIDLQGSFNFVEELQQTYGKVPKGAAAECGAGIGRVTKGLLLSTNNITRCDLIESSERLLFEAPEYIGDEHASKCRFYQSGLQDWEPRPQFYSIIWIQWVLCYLTDDDVVSFLQRCAKALIKDGGVIVLKENTCGDQTFVVDNDDASVCRSLPYWLKLVELAGLKVVLQRIQSDFPEDLFPVPMLALVPANNMDANNNKDDENKER